jgi:predicted outer membrane repeat protein
MVRFSDINNCRFRQNTAGFDGGAILRPFVPFAPLAELTLKGTVFQNNNAAFAGDDIWNDDPTTVECGDGYGNCFCDADNTNDISTNDLPATCAGDGVGPDCQGCNPSAAPIVCSGDNGPVGAVAVSTRAEESSPTDMDIVDMAKKVMERIKRKHPGQNRHRERAI